MTGGTSPPQVVEDFLGVVSSATTNPYHREKTWEDPRIF
jgi:hypothetical protein